VCAEWGDPGVRVSFSKFVDWDAAYDNSVQGAKLMDEKVNELKDTVKELILNITARIDDISEEYNVSGNEDSERLVNLFDDLQALAEGVNAIKESYAGLDLLEFRDKVEMMEEAMEAQDTMLVFDILRFEIKDLLIYWMECLSN
jgi:hypothetical protein